MNFEDILEIVGPFGTYQILLWALNAYGILALCGNMVFSTFGNIKPTSVSCTDSDELRIWNDTNNHTCNLMKACDNLSMTYEFKSVIIDMRLVCEKDIYTMFNTVLMIGVFAGSVLFGQLSDFFGRKWTTQTSFVMLLVTGLASAFCTSWRTYLFAKAINGVFVGGYMVTSYVLLNEVTGSKYRLFVRAICNWSFGICGFALTAYLTRDWRLLTIVNNCQCGLGIIAYCFVHESPRYLLQHGRFEEACQVLRKIGKVNRRPLDEAVIKSFRTAQIASTQPKKRYNLRDLFSTRQLTLYSVAILYLFFSLSVVTYSLLFSQVSLGGDKFINMFIFGATGQLLLIGVTILDRFFPRYFGRKPIALCCLSFILLAAVIVTISIAVPGAKHIREPVETYLSVISNGVASLAWAALWLFSIELYPTVIRNVASASCGASARLGGILAPLLASYLNTVWPALQYVVIGVLLIIAIISTALILPETSNKDMPELTELNFADNNETQNNKIV